MPGSRVSPGGHDQTLAIKKEKSPENKERKSVLTFNNGPKTQTLGSSKYV